MSEYTPHFAPFVIVAFLGTGFVLVVCALTAILGWLCKSRRVALTGTAGLLSVVTLYTGVLLALSLFSQEVVLPAGSWKYFCEIDCHIADSVAAVVTGQRIGPETQQVVSDGKFVIVQIKTWFDAATISPHRGNGPLTPNDRTAFLYDAAGHRYGISPKAEAVLAATGTYSMPLRTALRPGESYMSYLVFEVPGGTGDLRLLLSSADEVNILLWGHEQSPFHKKILLALDSPNHLSFPGSL